jgi:hypothetical protein
MNKSRGQIEQNKFNKFQQKAINISYFGIYTHDRAKNYITLNQPERKSVKCFEPEDSKWVLSWPGALKINIC